MKKGIWLFILILILLTLVILYIKYFNRKAVYLSNTVEVILKDLDNGCNFDGRHYTIVKVINGRENLLNELVLIDGDTFHEYENTRDSTREFKVLGKYSLFQHNENWAGCTGAHYFKVAKVISVTSK